MLKTIEKLQLTEPDLRKMYKHFCRSDKEFFRSVREERTAVGDAVFALIDIDGSGELDFSEYVEALGAFCLLNTQEILKFCFFVFDLDKSGTIEDAELAALLEVLHADGGTSNMKEALERFQFSGDGKIDFREFESLNQQFPTLLYPVYRLQENLRAYSMGEAWWTKRAVLLQAIKDEKDKPEGESKEAIAAKRRAQLALARRKMGCFRYYFCPCRRSKYMVDEDAVTEAALIEEAKRREIEAQKKKLEEAMEARARKERLQAKRNVVAADGRPVMSKEQRKERAKKRRQRDMKDLPTRK
ncbi:hypothetical protein SPRG_04740 [Saprolegnia parasitica CBS 223.65]|uniref:EF-hand domain-containing protein n=1 Tax=Saprolegnia parasitica (strain CBS 223.65) TaxID=695850 RepID=A0A067CJD1_SAPPC|nr:hypothetical protein SPRG_04740 [Saprolegnia parasitica CBS 223.65]KDO30839.1 hypothetical protein SPRG_04740 [Saprolegnia parasitica CBS 223.65]|eukprot:XP_012198536.1 hypothetical protein SPRG_04740 [Saprolegnia parasitica CBS 223.65]